MNVEVKIVNTNDIDELKNKIRMASSRIMMSSMTKLIGVALYRFKLKIDDLNHILPEYGLACVRWCKPKDEFILIPEIWFSPKIHDWSVKQITFVIIHEILHTLDRHQSRGKNKDGIIWNLAADHVINRRIKQDIHNGNNIVETPSQIFIVDDWEKEDLTAEEVYDRIMKEKEKNKITITVGDGKGDITVQYKGKTYKFDADLLDNKGNADIGDKEVNEIKSIIRGAIESEVFKQNNKGDESGGIVEYLQNIVEIEIPWHMLLEKALHKYMPVRSDDRSWKVINKRMLSHGLMMPYRDTTDVSESNLYILVDNSGSISRSDLQKFASIITNSAGFFSNVIIFKHDIEIKEIINLNDNINTNVDEIIKGVGRGGTSHKPVFNEIEKRVYSEFDPDDVGLVLMLTDYESDIEEIWESYKWTKEIPVKIILTEQHDVAEYVDKHPIYISKVKV